MARQGWARHGSVGRGAARKELRWSYRRFDSTWEHAGRGAPRRGTARHGKAWRGPAWQGMWWLRWSYGWFDSSRERARQCTAVLGRAGRGAARRCWVGQGMEGGRVAHIQVRVLDAHAWLGVAWPGWARLGRARQGDGGVVAHARVRVLGLHVRLGAAGHGTARHGAAPQDKERSGTGRHRGSSPRPARGQHRHPDRDEVDRS